MDETSKRKKRAAHFSVEDSERGFNGKREATVHIETRLGGRTYFVVRPKHGRETYELLLSDVAVGVVQRILKNSVPR